MTEPFKIACGACDFVTEDAAAMADHLLTTQHGLPAGFAADLAEGGGIHDFVEMLKTLQTNPEAVSEPVAEEDLPPEVLDALLKVQQRRAAAGVAALPEGSAIRAATLEHDTKPYDVDIFVFKGQPRGEARVFRRGETVRPVLTRALGMEEIAMFIARRGDLIEPFLDALIVDAEGVHQ